MKHLLCLLVFCFFYSTINADRSPFKLAKQKEVIAFQIWEKLIFVSAEVNQKKGWFLLDTGASEFSLNVKYFENFTESNMSNIFVDVNGQKALLNYASIKQFNLGAIKRSNFHAPLLDLTDLEYMVGKKVLGLVGYEFLRHFETFVNYDNKTITLFRLNEEGIPLVTEERPSPMHTFQFELKSKIPVLNAQIGKYENISLALDSGASLNVLHKVWKKRLSPYIMAKHTVLFSGSFTEPRKTDYFNFSSIVLEDKIGIKYWKAALQDISNLQEVITGVDGIMGINFFRLGQVSINYQTKTIKAWKGKTNTFNLRSSIVERSKS